jgi:hypothetical protein
MSVAFVKARSIRLVATVLLGELSVRYRHAAEILRPGPILVVLTTT